MKLVERLIKLTFKQAPIEDSLLSSKEVASFVDGQTMNLKIYSDGKTVQLSRKSMKTGRVLVLSRKNNEVLNPRKLCFDVASSTYSFGESKRDVDNAILSVLRVQSLMSVDASIMARDLTKRLNLAERGLDEQVSRQKGFKDLYQTWKSTLDETLDSDLKDKMLYMVGIWEGLESMLKDIDSFSSGKAMKFDWALDFINFSGSCLYSSCTLDSSQAPQANELKKICAGLCHDLISISEQEYSFQKWWDSDEIIERAKKWLEVLEDLKKVFSENMMVRLKENYVDPQVTNHEKVLQKMVDIHEILKQARRFQSKNKVLKTDLKYFMRLISRKNGDVVQVYDALLNHSLLTEVLRELKDVFRSMTTSEQLFNSLNFFTQISDIVLTNPKFSEELKQEKTVLATRVAQLSAEIESESRQKYESRLEEVRFDIGDTSSISSDKFVTFVKEWLPFSKKLAKIHQFFERYYQESSDKKSRMSKRTGLQDEFDMEPSLSNNNNSGNSQDQLKAISQQSLQTSEKIMHSCKELVTNWDSQAQETVDEVAEDMEQEELIDLDLDAGVMQFNFPEKLVDLIRTRTDLSGLGFDTQISKKVKVYVQDKQKVFQEAVKLKKVSNFYNSLADMNSVLFKCHRPLLLDRVTRLQNTIKNMDADLETHPEKLRAFIKKVEASIDAFQRLNSRLRSTHSSILADFLSLYGKDLVARKKLWSGVVHRAKTSINAVTSQIEEEALRNIKDEGRVEAYREKFRLYKDVWTNHLSYQLLKVLCYQLKKTLLGISEYVPRIEAKVKMIKGKLVVSPSVNEIRSKVYASINGMVEYPRSLKFGDNWPLFLDFVPGQCNQCLTIAYAEADRVVARLDAKLADLKGWVALSNLDPQSIGKKKSLNKGAIWKKVVETLKLKRRELGNEDDLLEAGCVVLNISQFKNQAEEAMGGVLAGVMHLLESSLLMDSIQIKVFVDSMTKTLDKQPTSTEELKKVWATFDEIQDKNKEYKGQVESFREKVRLITSLGRMEIASADVIKEWDAFEARLRNFKEELRDKQDAMKGEIEKSLENLNIDVEKFEAKWQASKLGPHEAISPQISKEYLSTLTSLRKGWAELQEKVASVNRDLDHFGMDSFESDTADNIDTEMTKELSEWQQAGDFSEELANISAKKHIGNPKTVFEFQDFLVSWLGKVKGGQDRVSLALKQTVEEYQIIWPTLKLIVGEAFQREHWTSLMFELGIQGVTTANLTFGHLIAKPKNLIAKSDKVKELAARAQGEVTIREAIEELDAWCGTAEFELLNSYKDTRGDTVPLIKEWNDMMTRVGDNQALLQSIKDSKFYSRFQDRIAQFDKRIGGLFSYLQRIQQIQRRWLYLEPIFGKGSLPSQQERFDGINSQFKSIMNQLQKNKKIAMVTEITGIDSTLDGILEQVEICQSALNKYLEDTRRKFPRFYFLGNEDLLEILGQSEKPAIIKLHLKKIFAGIHDIKFQQSGPTGLQIQAMLSSAGESVALAKPVPVSGVLDEWLTELEAQMVGTLKSQLLESTKNPKLQVGAFAGQIFCISMEVQFSGWVSSAIKEGKLTELKTKMDDLLDKSTSSKAGLVGVGEKVMKSFIMDLIHQIAIVEELVVKNVKGEDEWPWFKQLKYRINRKKRTAEIMMCKSTFDYSYEYQGNPGKLVHTPLTDKCYLTLTQGMMLGFGGNPYGPAGTGKTESVKALGQAFARMVLVFNCDENLDYKAMGRIFIGLVKCGAWGCFDEFNRLAEEQLSAISQQIQLIQDAIKDKRRDLNLLGIDVKVNFNSGIFVTLNPAGKGYGGRSKLPDNLKQLFRPVAMSKPNNELISEVLLFAEGFKSAASLSNKIVSIFNLSKQILSKQQHYDWSLRALKSILTTAGGFITIQRKKLAGKEISKHEETKMETEILLKALKDNTNSKLTSADLIKFNALINDVLPGVKVPEIRNEELIAAVEKTLSEQNLDLQERQISKILQFRSVLLQRMGVVIMGPSGSGKTTIWSVLKTALKKLGVTVKTYIMNPKAISRSQLLGHMDVNTREFKNGVLTAAARKAVKEPENVQNWIICDGDVDPKWIEALNSVLDDNHLLTLPTGERISFGDNVNFIFETHDLKYASPATVSRMGMIYLNDDDVNISSLLSKWKRDNNLEEDAPLSKLLAEFFEPVLELLKQREDEQCVKTTQMGMIMNLLSQVKGAKDKKQFSVLLMRGLVGNFPSGKRDKLIRELESLLGEKLGFTLDYDLSLKRLVQLKAQDSDRRSAAPARGNQSAQGGRLCVRTPYVQANIKVIQKCLQENESLIVVGPQGSGKSLMIEEAVREYGRSKKTKMVTIFCNSQTKSAQIIEALFENCNRQISSTHAILKPKDCHRLIVLLRDINLAKPDEYESIELISFLQQLSSHRGFYDEELDFVEIDSEIEIVVSMNSSSDLGRHQVSTRLTASTRILFVDHPSKEDMQTILEQTTGSTLQKSEGIKEILKSIPRVSVAISTFLIELFEFVKKNFTPEQHAHYVFSPKDSNKVLEGMLGYQVESKEDLGTALLSESATVYKNRLVGPEEISKYSSAVRRMASSSLGALAGRPDSMQYTALVSRSEELTKVPKSDYIQLLEKYVQSYERENYELGLSLSGQTVDTVSIVEKILCKSGGRALLIGKSGSGKKIAVKIACHALNIEYDTFYIGQNYALRDFRRDLRRMLELAGVQDKKVCAFLEDYQIVEPSFIEDINSLLSSNQVPGVFTQEEVEILLKDQAEELRIENYGKSVWECFLERVGKNLRVVLSLEPSNSQLSGYLTNNPALLKKCDIAWMREASSDSLRQYAQQQLLQPFTQTFASDAPDGVYDSLVEVYNQCGRAPREFYTMVQAYGAMVVEKVGALKKRARELKSGLDKIGEANVLVDNLSQQANIQKQELSVKQAEADTFMKEIQKSYEDSSDQKREAEEIRTFLKKEESKTLDKRMRIEEELRDVQPIVEAAKKEVKGIKKQDLSELKSYKDPKSQIIDAFEALFMLMGQGRVSWTNVKKQMSGSTFLNTITSINARKISTKARDSVKKLIKKNPGSFDGAKMRSISKAAAPIAVFVVALVRLSETFANIKPLEEAMAEVDRKLAASKAKLASKDLELKKIDVKVANLKKSYGEKTSQSESLKLKLQEAEDRINKATVLLGKLLGEKSRWEKGVTQIQQEQSVAPRDCLLSAAFIAYLSRGSEELREGALDRFKQVLERPDFRFVTSMAEESQILEYVSEGLPPDQLTTENAICLRNPVCTPLVIDPDGNFSEWILKTHEDTKVNEVVFSKEDKLMTRIELAIRFGKTLVVRDIDTIDRFYYAILKKELKKVGPRMVVQLGEKVVDWNADFRLIFLSRNSSLKLEGFTASLVSTINNLVTAKGLEEKLLSIVINHERPDIEEKKRECLVQERNLKIEIAKLEQQLLQELAATEGNILENVALLNSLNETKSKSIKISEALENSKSLQDSLSKERDIYKPLAETGTDIFLLLRQLKDINHMYSFSLQEYTGVFKQNLESGGSLVDKNDTPALIKALSRGLYKATFTRFGYCMFKKDKLAFGLHLVRQAPKAVSELEYNFLLGRTTQLDSRASLPSWADQNLIERFSKYSGAFASMVKGLRLENEVWSRWATKKEPETSFPSKMTISPFQKVLLVRTFRPDRTERALENFVCETLGLNGLNQAINSVSSIYSVENSSEVPILFITSLGSDPSKELDDFSTREVGTDRFMQLSMGGGQNQNALRMLEECATQGKWLFLKNLHLVPGFIPDLEKTFSKIPKQQGFKLWLTTEEQEKFSTVFLESCFKVSYESPPGIRMNVERIYLSVSNSQFKEFSEKRARMVFLVSYFHALLQERRTYIPQGWSKYYEFSQSDFKAGNLILDSVMTEFGVDWSGLFGLFENAIYGGRIDKPTDIEILKAYLRKMFSQTVLETGKLPSGMELPPSKQLRDHLKHLKKLPDTNTPQTFGLPAVIQNSLQRKNVGYTIKMLKGLGLGASSGGTGDEGDSSNKDKMRLVLEPFVSLWQNIYNKIQTIPELLEQYEVAQDEDVLVTVIYEETTRRQKLIKMLNGVFTKMDGVLQGKSSMTSDLQTIIESLMKNRLPSVFDEVWDGCEDPEEWIKIIARKTAGLRIWLKAAKAGKLETAALPLGSFLDPEIVLNSLRQKTCRTLGTSLDKLRMVTVFGKRTDLCKIYLSIGDLQLEGVMMNDDDLVKASVKAPESTKVASVHLGYVLKPRSGEGDQDQAKQKLGFASGIVDIPVYLSRDKEMKLCTFSCPYSGDRDDILLAGASFFLNQFAKIQDEFREQQKWNTDKIGLGFFNLLSTK